MGLIKRKKCKNCSDLFIPDDRNAKRQQYCTKPACRKASKAASQQRWLQKPENQNYWCGPDNVARVQRWRKVNPGYWRRESQKRHNALQDPLNEQPSEIKTDKGDFAKLALQDSVIGQPAVLIGLIANLIEADLIAFKSPLYQVLSLEVNRPVARSAMKRPLSLGDILKKAAAGGGP